MLRAVAYAEVSQNPSSNTRTSRCIVTDGDSGTRHVDQVDHVRPVNDRPVLDGISGSLGYVHNSTAMVLASSATVTDVDSDNFGGGRLRARSLIDTFYRQQPPEHRRSLYRRRQQHVLLNGVVIGTRTEWLGTNELMVRSTTTATKAIVQQFVRALRSNGQGAAGSAAK